MEGRLFLKFLAPLAAEGIKSGVASGGLSTGEVSTPNFTIVSPKPDEIKENFTPWARPKAHH